MTARSRRGAYSLVELLIVVAIVALLVSLLAPLAGAAREQGRRVACASNLRQIAGGWLAYVHEVDGFPVTTPSINLIVFYGGREDCALAGDRRIPRPRPINAYVGAAGDDPRSCDVFRCPSDSGLVAEPGAYEFLNCDTAIGLFGTSYLTNEYLVNGQRMSGFPSRVRPLRPEDVAVPQALMILAGDAPFFWAVAPQSPVSAGWHESTGRGVNLGFLDGHAAFTYIRPGQFTTSDYAYRPRW